MLPRPRPAPTRGTVRARLARRLTAYVMVGGGALAALAAATGDADAATPELLDGVAVCDASDESASDRAGGPAGALLRQSTWAAFGGTAYAPSADLATSAQQIDIAEKVLKVHGPGAWPGYSAKPDPR